MNQKNVLIFATDGKSVQVKFENGEFSPVYRSQQTAFEALNTFSELKKISVDEYKVMVVQIADCESFPFSDENILNTDEDFEELVNILYIVFAMGSFDKPAMFEKAEFTPCYCGEFEKHGRINTKNGRTNSFSTPRGVPEMLAKLLIEGKISEEEQIEVQKQVDDFFAEPVVNQ